ncbi:MAG: DUF1631 family protein [Burkholderiales bacterium]|nr:DUF1631 family protein [Burkholderiales bacterium]
MADLDRFSLFTEARERLGRAFVRALSAALPEMADTLEQSAGLAASIVGRRQLLAAAAVLRMEADGRTQRALARLYDLTFRMLELNQSPPPADGEPPMLSLLGEEELDHQILADEVAKTVREHLGAACEVALRRVDGLTRTVSDDARAPLGPSVLAAAALDALRPLTSERATRGAARAAAIERLAPRLAEAIVETDAWLAARGVEPWSPPAPEVQPLPLPETAGKVLPLPGVRETTPMPDPAPNRRAAGPIDLPEAEAAFPAVAPIVVVEPAAEAVQDPARLAPSSPAAIDDALAAEPDAQSSSPAAIEAIPAAATDATPAAAAEATPAAAAEAAPATAIDRAGDAIVEAISLADVLGRQPFAQGRPEAAYRYASGLPRPDALQEDAVAFAHHVGVAPYTRAARQRYFDALRQRMQAAEAAPGQIAALDLVASLFDYVVDDSRMPPAAQPLLWRLQHPALTLAALDAGYLGDDRRSIRRLVEHLAAISVAYADDVTQGSELYRRLDTVVRAVEVVSHAFQTRSTVLGEQVRREYQRAAQGVTQLVSRVANERHALDATPGRRNRRDYTRRPSREREQVVTRRLESELHERIDRHDVPDSVRDFLLGVWLRHLRTAMLRDGEGSSSYRLALQVVDDLLWSLDAGGPRPSRRQLASRIPPLIKLLTQGVTDIGARPEEFRPFLDELFLIHLRKMQKTPRDGDDMREPATRPAPPPGDAFDALPTLDETLPDTLTDAADVREAAARDAAGAPDAAPSERDAVAPTDAAPAAAGAPADDRSRRALSPGSRLGWLRRGTERPDPPRTGFQRLVSDDDEPIESWPEEPVRAAPVPKGPEPLAASQAEAPGTSKAASQAAPAPDAPLPPLPAPSDLPRGAAIAREGEPPPVVRAPLERRADPEGAAPEHRLLSVLSEVSLADFPLKPQRLQMGPDDALARLSRGDWLELIGRDGEPQDVKVAWINSRRTVVLLVRRPDRRALSLRATELRERFATQRASLIV